MQTMSKEQPQQKSFIANLLDSILCMLVAMSCVIGFFFIVYQLTKEPQESTEARQTKENPQEKTPANPPPTKEEFFDAISNGDLDRVIDLTGVNREFLSAKDDTYGATPLHQAAYNQHQNIVEWLLDQPETLEHINETNNSGQTALYQAQYVKNGTIANLISNAQGRSQQKRNQSGSSSKDSQQAAINEFKKIAHYIISKEGRNNRIPILNVQYDVFNTNSLLGNIRGYLSYVYYHPSCAISERMDFKYDLGYWELSDYYYRSDSIGYNAPPIITSGLLNSDAAKKQVWIAEYYYKSQQK